MEDVHQLLATARQHRDDGRLDEALICVEQALIVKPDYFPALAEMGQIKRRQDDRTGSNSWFEQALAVSPHDVNVRVEIAHNLRVLERFEDAISILLAGLALEPQHFWALMELGQSQLKTGRREEAVAAFQAAALADPDHPAPRVALSGLEPSVAADAQAPLAETRSAEVELALDLAGQARARRALGEAAEHYRRAVALNPALWRGWIELGQTLRDDACYDEAIAALEVARDLNPANCQAIAEMAQVRRRQGDRTASAALFELAISVDPQPLYVYVELTSDLRILNRPDEADRVVKAALARDPRYFWALMEQGQVRRRLGDSAGAIDAFRAAAEVEPTHSAPRVELARELRVAGRFEEALEELRDLNRRNPRDVTAAIVLSQLLLDMHLLEEAGQVLRTAQAGAPDDAQLTARLGHLARRQGDRADAMALFTRAADLAPDNPDYRLDCVVELRDDGEFDAALRLVQTVLERHPGHWNAWMQLGYCQRALGDFEAALSAFERAGEVAPSNAFAFVEAAREHWSLGRPAQAATMLQSARELDPHNVIPLIVEAEYALAAEDPEAALDNALKAMERDPSNIWPYMVGARAASAMVDLTQAMALLDRAQAAFGQISTVAITRSLILREFREYQRAKDGLDQLPASLRRSFDVWQEYARLQLLLGDFAALEVSLRDAPAATRLERAAVLGVRAQLAAARQDHGAAVGDYEAAVALAPYAGHWRYELARTYLLVGRTDEARRELKVWVRLNPSLNRVQGRSMNASQNHIGQMLDDFVLDADMLHDVRAALALPLAEQPQALLDLVRLEPDATAPALLYIIACIRLRIHAHRKAAPGPVGPEARPDQLIPKKIIQFWDADPPQEVLALMALWGERNPDYAYERFDDRSAAAFIAQHHGREVSEAFRRSVHPAQRADLFRLAYLSVCGGIYVDADDMCLTPLDLYIPQASKLFAYQEDMGTLANNFLGAAPGHPVIQRALKCGVEAVNRGDSDMIWLLTGPGLVTRAFAQIAAEGHMDMTPERICLFENWEMSRVMGIHRPARYKNTSRHWSRVTFRMDNSADKRSA